MKYRQWKKNYKKKYGANPPFELDKRKQRRYARKMARQINITLPTMMETLTKEIDGWMKSLKDAVERHEMWHMKQAEEFRKAGWEITKENRSEYLKELCKKAKKNLDALGITQDNVSEISDYAYQQYQLGRYDETEAEYMLIYNRR